MVLGHHSHQDQNKIAFPEMAQYSHEDNEIDQVDENPHFNIAVNPHPPLLGMLPMFPHANPLVLSPCFGETPQGLTVQDDDDFPHGDGEEAPDAYDSIPLLLTSVAGVLQPSDPSQAYIFCGNRYVTIKVIPGTMGDTTTRGSNVIVNDWLSLLRTMFAGKIDAVLPIPNNREQMYFFAGENYALINVDTGL